MIVAHDATRLRNNKLGKIMKRLKSALVVLAAGAMSLSAYATPFTVSSTAFTLGSGYGTAVGNPGAGDGSVFTIDLSDLSFSSNQT